MMDLMQEPDDAKGAEGLVTERKIALFGTGAALHLSEKLRGFVNAEPAPATTSDALCQRFGFLGFSARTGAVDNLKGLGLIFDAALSGKTVAAWQRSDGRFVDPFRPSIEPEGLADEAEVQALQQSHQLALRRVLNCMDELILVLDGTAHGRDAHAGIDYPFIPDVDFPSALRDRIVPHVPDLDELDADFTAMFQRLNGLRPGLMITLALAPSRPNATSARGQQRQLTELRYMMAEWSSRFDTVRYLPIWEMAQMDSAAEMWAKAASLTGASAPLLAAATPLPEAPDEDQGAPVEADEERRARRAAKRERKLKRANVGSGTVCEDELLEAFAR